MLSLFHVTGMRWAILLFAGGLAAQAPEVELLFKGNLSNTGLSGGVGVFENPVAGEEAKIGSDAGRGFLDLRATRGGIEEKSQPHGGGAVFPWCPAGPKAGFLLSITPEVLDGLPRRVLVLGKNVQVYVENGKLILSLSGERTAFLTLTSALRAGERLDFAVSMDLSAGSLLAWQLVAPAPKVLLVSKELPPGLAFARANLVLGNVDGKRPFAGRIHAFCAWDRALSIEDLKHRLPAPAHPASGAPSISLALLPSAPAGVALAGETASLRLVLSNEGPEPRSIRLAVFQTNDDARGSVTEEDIALARNSGIERRFPAPPIPAYTAFHVVVREAGKLVAEGDSALLVVRPPRAAVPGDSGAFFGMMNAQFEPEAARRIGVRQHRQWFHMASIKPAMDQAGWAPRDAEMEAVCAKGMGILATLEVRGEMLPRWTGWKTIEDAATPEGLVHWRAFVRAVVSRYKDRLIGVELINEPDNVFWHQAKLPLDRAARAYGALLRAGSDEIRKIAPGLPILGLDVSGRDFATLKGGPREGFPGGFAFTRAVLAEAPEALDVFSGHPYSYDRTFRPGMMAQSPDAMGFRALHLEARELISRGPHPLRQWTSECGWSFMRGIAPWGPESQRYAATVAQALTLMKSVPRFEKAFWMTFHWHNWQTPQKENYGLFGCSENEASQRGPLCPLPLYPFPAAAAYATTAWHLEYTRPVRPVELGTNLCAWRFDRQGEPVSTLVLYMPVHAEGLLSAAWPAGCAAVTLFGRELGLRPGNPLPVSSLPVFLTVAREQAEALEGALRKASLRDREPLALRKVFWHALDRVGVQLEAFGEPRNIVLDVGGAESRFRIQPGRATVFLEKIRAPREGEMPIVTLRCDEFTRQAPLPETLPCPMRAMDPQHPLLDQAPPLPIMLSTRDSLMPVDAGWSGPGDLSAAAAFCWDAAGLAFFAAVTDDVHAAPFDHADSFWQSDSIQIGLDLGGEAVGAYDAACREIGLVLGKDGAKAYLSSPREAPRPLSCRVEIVREGTRTRYALHAPWKELGIEVPPPGRVMAMNFIVNENDGQGRGSWMGLTPGIGDSKAPEKFRSFALVGPAMEK